MCGKTVLIEIGLILGLDEARLDKLRKRMSHLLQHFPFIEVMKEEYGNDSCEVSFLH